MRLVIHTMGRTAAGDLGRYHTGSPTATGSGVFSNLARKVFATSGVQHIINSVKDANLPQKIADLAEKGAKKAGEHLGKKAGSKLAKVAHDKGLGKFLPTKRKGSSLKTARRPRWSAEKHARYDRLINRHQGSGILLE